MKKNIVLIIMGIIILLLAEGIFLTSYRQCNSPCFPPFWGGPGRMHPEPMPDDKRFLEMLGARLDLSGEQMEKLKQIHARYEPSLDGYRKRVFPLITELERALTADSLDEKKIRKTLEEIDAVKREERLIHIRMRFEAQKTVFTPQQVVKLNDMLEGKFKKHRKRLGID